MKALFSLFTRLSLRFYVLTLVLVIAFLALGVVAVTQLQQELLPSIAFPQTVILAQVSGMSSDEALNVLTRRLEDALAGVPDIVNLESTTTGAIGSVIIARNNFGENQARLQQNIRAALDSVWLPQRRIEAPAGENPSAFAQRLMADLTPDVLIWLHTKDPNFLFQLAPETWSALGPDTARVVLGYLASQVTTDQASENALQDLVEQEIVPQLESMDVVARVSVSGGQVLPGEENGQVASVDTAPKQPQSLLLQLSPEAWAAASARAGVSGALNSQTVEALKPDRLAIPRVAPPLPASWQQDGFKDASDLWEMRSLTRTVAATLNTFVTEGRIVGALGKTDDLTPEVIRQMLAIQPSMTNYFKAEHLAAMSPEVFAALPPDYIAGLDGFTRDELAAKSLAASITGEQADPPPVELPSPWRIAPPQLISFSFDDIPLASFSVFSSQPGTDTAANAPAENTEAASAVQATPEPQPTAAPENIPEGPALPPVFTLFGTFLGVQINTADDLLNIQLPEAAAAQFGGVTHLPAAQLFNFLMLLRDPESLPAGMELPPLVSTINPDAIIGSLSPEVIAFLAEYDPTFLPTLSADVYEAFSDEVLSLPQAAPPLADVWDTLAGQPQFDDRPLKTAADVLAIGAGKASTVLNTINDSIPAQFAGYEVRLFDSLTPATARYFALQEPGFYSNLDAEVLHKLSPPVLALLPEESLSRLDEATANDLRAIASGQQESAAQALASQYTTNLPPADPAAPPVNPQWKLVADFYGIELDTADDFFRFPEDFTYPTASAFMNSIFASPQGVAFAPNLFGNLSVEAVEYMLQRDPAVFDDLIPDALRLLPDDVLAALPQPVQDRARAGGEVFTPTHAVTRTNGSNSLLVTVYKTSGANTVAAFHTVADALKTIDAQDDTISTSIVFEQSSFIEESISGVAREGGLGGIFAVIIILVFLSAGVWSRGSRRITGLVLAAIFLALLVLVVLSGLDAASGDFGLAFQQADPVVRVLLLLGAVAGVLIFLWPGRLPYPAWRSTLVVAVSIPLSLAMALAVMNWIPPFVHNLLEPAAETSPIVAFLIRLFPATVTLNIMTLSGLTVAIGRVVDDSIVVLENIFREIQAGGDKRQAIITGTRDVSVAIFSATVITVVVFLPLGLTGGIISEFFLPFGLTVTYALMSSFVVAITVVPVLAYLFISPKEAAAEGHEGTLERLYLPVLRWSLASSRNRWLVLGAAAVSFVLGILLFATRPTTFLPELGEPQITVSVNLPAGTKILETNEKVRALETFIETTIPQEERRNIQTIIGSGGANLQTLLGGNSGVSENIANLTLGVESREQLDHWAQQIRAQAEAIFGKENVTVSAASISEQGFGGFAVVLSGPQDNLAAINQKVIDTLNTVPGLTNVSSNLAQVSAAGGDDGPTTYIRIDRESAVRFTGELETENTLGVTREAIETIKALPDLPPTIKVSQGFESELQTEGFQSLFVAMGIAIVIVVLILMVTFGSVVHWLDIILSVAVAPVGAAVLLALTNRVLGISAMIGLLMLIGIVVTNAVVLIDRVQANRRERGMPVRDALIEAGGRRLRPILMTALATIFALMPLAIGLSKGAIIAAELGTVVIGGLFSSTLLTLIVVPVAYSLLAPVHKRVMGVFGRREEEISPEPVAR
ncbi:MAG: efflux RND transporter permease subunit [Chloroflexi bacterium]|nr:efflux RND transporter permease subunit [Chloroflexota bacterium]